MGSGWGKDRRGYLSGAAVLYALAFTILALSFPASDAWAISAPIHVANTGGEGVYIRPDPNTSRAPIGWMPEGASPDFNCFAWGQNVNGVPIWFNVNYGGVTGYYASYYDDSSYHSNEELTAKYGVPLCGSAPPAPAPPPSGGSPGTPASGHVFGIVNAEEGIYYRESPSWGDTKRITGVGVYNGDRVELICGALGDPVGPYSNKAWTKVRNLTRPSIGEGWVSEHFIDDGAPTNGWPEGVPQCGSSSSTTPPPSGPRSVFFSPTYALPNGVDTLGPIADLNIPAAMWVEGNCSTAGAANIPRGVETLAGWSLGRLAPLYVLAADHRRWGEVHRIVLFDPGSAQNMSGCDKAMHDPSVGYLLAEWLSSNPGNHLEVYTGKDTEEAALGAGRFQFGGLWHYYFPQIWNQPFAGQVKVCDYPGAGHAAILEKLAWEVQRPAAGCKPVDGLSQPIPWHP